MDAHNNLNLNIWMNEANLSTTKSSQTPQISQVETAAINVAKVLFGSVGGVQVDEPCE